MGDMGTRRHTKEHFGDQLKSARVRHNISLDQVATELRIPLRKLEALEEGDVSVFSAPVYAHGALRSYASWLGLRVQPLERELSTQLKEFANQTDLKIKTVPRWYERVLSGRAVLWATGVLSALVIGSYVFWQVGSFWRLPRIDITSPENDVINQRAVLIAGKTDSDVRIRINGEAAMLLPDNTFSQEVPLLPGVTVLQIEGENAAGRVRTVEKHVFRTSGAIDSPSGAE